MAHKKRFHLEHADAEIDLVPMIDCIFLLLLFFMLCGRITMDQRVEQITVPPTRTAMEMKTPKDWERLVINVFGSTQSGKPPRNTIRMNNQNWSSSGTDHYEAYIQMRRMLNVTYDRAEKFADPKNPSLQLPKVVLEIRADADTEYRVIQEIQQVVSDTIDPENKMMPKAPTKCFVHLNFTTRKPGDR
ncbi:MAG: Biopolymer transport protein ExbD/TolR [Pseudomonadota bacterium]|jgi:biopolymer transport protein ExbD